MHFLIEDSQCIARNPKIAESEDGVRLFQRTNWKELKLDSPKTITI